MYQALLEQDPAFEGIFFAGVITTGVFCRPTCPARKPRRENVVFFPSSREALHAGYRPCRRCRPMEPADRTPDRIRGLLAEAEADPSLRLKDADLRKRGIEPATLRRWFKKNHGLTFQGYLRALRIGAAFGRIRSGDTATDAAFDHGWESLSGFGEAFRRVVGAAPTHTSGAPVTLSRIETPLGPMLGGAGQEGICLLEFVDRRAIETQVASLRKRLKAALVRGSAPLLDQLSEQLRGYFAGSLRQFSLPLDLRGTPFQREAWSALLKIPFGQTRSYADQARLVGRASAVRAVARANGDNRIAILVPCHRVVGADGSLTGYGGGLWRKRWLLDHERRFLAS